MNISANTGKKRPTLGFFVSELENPYAQTLCSGITDAATAVDANVIVFPGKSPKVPYNYRYQYNSIYKLANKNNIDALILATGTMVNFLSDEEFKEFYSRYDDIPLVSISIPLDGVSSVLIDNKVGLRDVLEHLFTVHNLQKIAFIGGPENNVEAQERFQVYRETLEKHGVAFDPALTVNGDFTKYSGVRAVVEFLDNRKVSFQALAAANDEMALSAMEELQKRGFNIPRDIAVVGFDDVESANYSLPSLTTVAQPIYEQAHNAVRLACQLIESKEKRRDVTLPTSMVLRESCGCHLRTAATMDPFGGSFAVATNAASGAAARMLMLEEHFKSGQRRLDVFHRDVVGLRDLLSQLLCDVSNTKAALRSIIPNLREMGMACFYVFLHDTPEKHDITTDWSFAKNVTLIVADDGRPENLGPSGMSVPVGSILNGSLYPKDRRYTFVVSSLFFTNEHIGFVVCEPNLSDVYMFESLMVEISCALQLIYLMQTRQKIEWQLQDALEELEKHNEHLSNISETDEMTGLLNRRGFLNHARHMLVSARRGKKGGLLFFADLDGLKTINDTYGHEEGDNAIKVVASVLKKAYRESDALARLGGDEFTVLTLNTDIGMLDTFETRINGFVEEYNQKSQKPYKVSVSIGMVPFSHTDEDDIETLMSKADILLYQQKKEKKNRPTQGR